ncbi:YdcF family protein [bacterium]|jgi:uncharacterized SAM-binding protein YcdF (DUF218 family)|nr:YdcF family protein [bacterium]
MQSTGSGKVTSRSRHHVRRWAILAVSFLIPAILFRTTAYEWVGTYLCAADEEASGDVGFILGGGRSTRVDLAAQRLQEGRIQRVLVSRPPGLADIDGVKILPEHEIVVGMLRALDVPAEKIEVMDADCPNTKEEAKALAQYMKQHPDERVVVITSAYHVRRCRFLFGKAMGGDLSRVAFDAPVESGVWYRDPHRWRTYLLELSKLPAAVLASLWPW